MKSKKCYSVSKEKTPAKNVILVGKFYSNPVFTFEIVGVRKFSRLPSLNCVGSNKKQSVECYHLSR